MRTRSQARNQNRRQQQLTSDIVEEPEFPMADNRIMAQMLQAPIEGYEDAIVVPPINANNFELKQTLINLVQSNQFTGKQDPHNHLRFSNKIPPRVVISDKNWPRDGLAIIEHVNAIANEVGETCEGPSTPLVPTPVVSTPQKEPEQKPETSMDKVQKPSSESTAQVPPPEKEDSIFMEIPKPKAKKKPLTLKFQVSYILQDLIRINLNFHI
ncbi:hypothetical protein Tco_0976941 [Tanacetum coccineum]|uniref:Reverse transcriptase domain-containing protein n=1 Tax=Tanacetum coccineum TaxID=301880 RepID=A0ABQ5EIP5_9ASTR